MRCFGPKEYVGIPGFQSFRLFFVMFLICFPSNTLAQRKRGMKSNESNGGNESPTLGPTKFAMISKSLQNPFFASAHQACLDHAAILGVECVLMGPPNETEDAVLQVAIIDELIANQAVKGIAVAVSDAEILGPAIDRAVQAGIAVVTFDSDAPRSQRMAYIGTDNYFMGQTLARVLKQLKPHGGTYAALSSEAPNLQERFRGLLDELSITPGQWRTVPGSPSNYEGNSTLIQEQLQKFADLNPTAIIPLSGAVMRSGSWQAFVQMHPNVTLVSGDAMPTQLECLERNCVDGLVGQMPYEMGKRSIQSLYDIITSNRPPAQPIIITNILTHIRIPLLGSPPETVNDSFHYKLYLIGYTVFGIIATAAIMFAYSTWWYRHRMAIKTSQPSFLYILLCGVICMTASLIPLSSDNGEIQARIWYCMSIPWLCVGGISITYSALLFRIMRVNRMLPVTDRPHRQPTHTGQRNRQTYLASFGHYFVLPVVNVSILVAWTIFDPLTFERQGTADTDGWISAGLAFEACRSRNVERILVPLALLNAGGILLANWQINSTRNTLSELPESKQLGIANLILLQLILTGVPVLFAVEKFSRAFYLLFVFIIFATSVAILLSVFVPKLLAAKKEEQLGSYHQNADSNSFMSGSFVRGQGISAGFSSNLEDEQKMARNSSFSRISGNGSPELQTEGNDESGSTMVPPTDLEDVDILSENRGGTADFVTESSRGCFRRSSSTGSKSVRWSEIDFDLPTAEEQEDFVEIGETDVPPSDPSAEDLATDDFSENAFQRFGHSASSEESTIDEGTNIPTDSDLSSVISYATSTNVRSSMGTFRSSAGSLRSSGISFASSIKCTKVDEQGPPEQKPEEQRNAPPTTTNTNTPDKRQILMDGIDLPPLISCTEADGESIGRLSESVGFTTDHDDASERWSIRSGTQENRNI